MSDDLPAAIHGNAIDKACEDDRLWFEQNRPKRFRVRPVVPYEFNQRLAEAPEGFLTYVLVIELKKGVRFRKDIQVPAMVDPAKLTQSQLENLFRQTAPTEFQRAFDEADDGAA